LFLDLKQEDIIPRVFSVVSAAPFTFAVKRRARLLSAAPQARRPSVLSEQEVSICGDILTFARTYFEQS